MTSDEVLPLEQEEGRVKFGPVVGNWASCQADTCLTENCIMLPPLSLSPTLSISLSLFVCVCVPLSLLS